MDTSPTIKVGALILAAGFSRRFSDSTADPKESSKLAAKLSNGTSVLQQTINNISAVIADIRIVSRQETASHLLNHDSQLLIFNDAQLGMGASLSFGISNLPDWDACLVCLGDMPFIKPASYAQIAQQCRHDRIVMAAYHKQRTNPVGFGSQFFPHLSKLSGDRGGRDIIKQYAESLRLIAIEDPGLTADIDTIEQLKNLDTTFLAPVR